MTQPEVKIRQCADEDMVRITEIYGQSVLEEIASFELAPPDEVEMASRRQERLDKGMPYLVAELDGRVVGYAYAGSFHSRPAYGCTVENTVYVDPLVHRRGVGSMLMKALIEECTSLGFRQMVAVISGTEDAASIKMHKALGFKDTGKNRSVGFKHGRWIDTFSLQLALGPGDTTPPDKAPGS